MFRGSCSKSKCYSDHCAPTRDATLEGWLIEEEDCVKGLFAKLAIGVAALAFVTAAQAGETLDRVMGKKAMVVATNSGWPPQSYLDDSNELVGFDIESPRRSPSVLASK